MKMSTKLKLIHALEVYELYAQSVIDEMDDGEEKKEGEKLLRNLLKAREEFVKGS